VPITNQWWTLSEAVIDYDQDQPGVYELGDANGNVIYVGSADKLKRRLKDHVDDKDNACIKANASKYRLDYDSQPKRREKQLYDQHVLIYGKPPKCNKIAPSGY